MACTGSLTILGTNHAKIMWQTLGAQSQSTTAHASVPRKVMSKSAVSLSMGADSVT
jgi:hypothetical protein